MKDLIKLALEVGNLLLLKNYQLVTAESCTGGLLAQVLTANPGSSEWFERGFVTYTNIAKHELLGVANELIESFGAVSSQVAEKMAEGALKNSHADLSISITGIAGPSGGGEKPVGTVYLATCDGNNLLSVEHKLFTGQRSDIRYLAAEYALLKIRNDISKTF